MRTIIQLIIFLVVLYLGFRVVKFIFNYFPSSLTLGQQSILQLFLMFFIAIGSLVITKLLSRYITK